jgi:hypothetical protein
MMDKILELNGRMLYRCLHKYIWVEMYILVEKILEILLEICVIRMTKFIYRQLVKVQVKIV